MWNIHLAVAEKYTDNLREEAMKGWAEKLAQGWMPSRPPVGYKTMIEIVYASNSVSAKLSFLAESIAKKVTKHAKLWKLKKCLTKPLKKTKLTEVK